MQSRLGELGLQSIDVGVADDCFFRSDVSHQLLKIGSRGLHVATSVGRK